MSRAARPSAPLRPHCAGVVRARGQASVLVVIVAAILVIAAP